MLHGLPEIVLQVHAVGAGRLRLEVFDGSFALPEMRDPSVADISGRGLRLIDAISSAWGTRPLLNGKVVWCGLAEHRDKNFPRSPWTD